MKRKRMNKKELTLLVSIMLLVTVAVGGTLAFIATATGTVTNTFESTSVNTEVTEEFNGQVKNNVAVKNTGEAASYVRAEIVVTWKNAEGEVLAEKPVLGTDYAWTLLVGNTSKWVEGPDGFYYYTEAIAPGASTDILLTNAVTYAEKGDYKLSIDILVQSVQAEPAEAMADVWGVEIKDGSVSKVETE